MYPITNAGTYPATVTYLTTALDPTPDNNYLVNFKDYNDPCLTEAGQCWVNPYSRIGKSVKPYIPCQSLAPLFLEKVNPMGKEQCFYSASCFILIHLEPKDLANFSEVSQCCYLAAKPDFIWQVHIKKLLPNACCLTKFTCSFTPEQQFQVIFKKMYDRKKPFIEQIKHNCKRVEKLQIEMKQITCAQEKIENDPYVIQLTEQINQLQLNFGSQIKELSGQEGNGELDFSNPEVMAKFQLLLLNHSDKVCEIQIKIQEHLQDSSAFSYAVTTSGLQHPQLYRVTSQLKGFVGSNYDGSFETIHPNSQLGLCYNALNSIPGEFDDQEKFEIIIQSSETASQNSCLGIETQVEEVEDEDVCTSFGPYAGNHATSG